MSLDKSNQIKPQFLPIHTCVEQSPVCLIKDHTGPCAHKNCLMAYKKPQWFGISIEEFYNTHEFLEFTVIHSSYSHPHIIPKNPNPGAGDGFEGFRQSMNAIIHLAGSWPAVKTVARVDVEFRWVEHIDSYPVTDYQTGKVDWKQRLDVSEYAFYIGQINNTGIQEIDVNAVFELPEIFKGGRDLTSKDWCYCGSEGDWCGEDCYQPQNNPTLKKGDGDGK